MPKNNHVLVELTHFCDSNLATLKKNFARDQFLKRQAIDNITDSTELKNAQAEYTSLVSKHDQEYRTVYFDHVVVQQANPNDNSSSGGSVVVGLQYGSIIAQVSQALTLKKVKH